MIVTTERDGRVVSEKHPVPGGDAWRGAWQRQHERFRDCVESRTQPDPSGADGRAIESVSDALYRSAEENCEVEV